MVCEIDVRFGFAMSDYVKIERHAHLCSSFVVGDASLFRAVRYFTRVMVFPLTMNARRAISIIGWSNLESV